MKFAFSTIGCPKWDLQTVAARAKEYGYDGVELRGFLNESVLTAANVFLTEPGKVRQTFADQGVAIACLGSAIAMTGKKKRDAQLAEEARAFVDRAAAIGTPLVRLSDTQARIGHDRSDAALALAQWLGPLADYAAQREVTLVVENLLSFRTAKEMWMMLEAVNHPAVACCWDVFNASQVGESPWVSVPLLNSKIQYVHVKDAKLGPLGATFCKLGEGDVPVATLLTRLRGIGYEGWVTFEWDKAWLANIAEPEDVFPDAITKLKEWTKPQIEVKEKVIATAGKH